MLGAEAVVAGAADFSGPDHKQLVVCNNLNQLTMDIITYPAPSEYADNVKAYIKAAQADDLLEGLMANQVYVINHMLELKEEQFTFRYQPDKWTIKEILVHLIDSERIFAYRALRFARQDATELPGFDQDSYIGPAKANNRTITNILSEYSAVRQATMALFRNLDAEALNQAGVAS